MGITKVQIGGLIGLASLLMYTIAIVLDELFKWESNGKEYVCGWERVKIDSGSGIERVYYDAATSGKGWDNDASAGNLWHVFGLFTTMLSFMGVAISLMPTYGHSKIAPMTLISPAFLFGIIGAACTFKGDNCPEAGDVGASVILAFISAPGFLIAVIVMSLDKDDEPKTVVTRGGGRDGGAMDIETVGINSDVEEALEGENIEKEQEGTEHRLQDGLWLREQDAVTGTVSPLETEDGAVAAVVQIDGAEEVEVSVIEADGVDVDADDADMLRTQRAMRKMYDEDVESDGVDVAADDADEIKRTQEAMRKMYDE